MAASASTSPHSLGADLRALRLLRGLTLSDLSARLGRSVGWLSQVERDKSDPSVADLREIAAALDVPLSTLFGEGAATPEEKGLIVRKTARRPIGNGEGGLIEELLSPDLTDSFEVVHSTFQPGAAMAAPVSRPTQEVGFVVSGTLELWIGDHAFTLGAGDSFRIRGQSYRWANSTDTPTVVIWVISPPVY
ncbi:helix-turn-helix domain-containing protein [Brevirhabdus sp.]|uniref:helix-turn-helix domain-containing protein n=1 Tax=Brevirhabdus sp. TaxID=2004514 RepID=UPI004058D8B5